MTISSSSAPASTGPNAPPDGGPGSQGIARTEGKKRSGVRSSLRAANAKRSTPTPKPIGIFRMPKRVVAIGDLNGDDDALAMMLRSLDLTDARGDWIAHGVHLVQMGDVVNRGSKSRAALERLRRLQEQALAKQSRVTVLLGNHEAMTILGNEAWVTPDEYMEFATDDQRIEFELARARKTHQLLVNNSKNGRTGPVTGQLRAWEEANAPGKVRFAHAFSADGDLGAWIRTFPVAIRIGSVVFVHGGLRPRFARIGIETLNASVKAAWAKTPATQLDLDPTGPILAEDGPLWERGYALHDETRINAAFSESLEAVSAKMMVVGHTRTDHVPGGSAGTPMLRHNGRLACVDVGIGGTGGSSAALFIEKGVVWAWRPDERKRRLGPLLGETERARPGRGSKKLARRKGTPSKAQKKARAGKKSQGK